MNVLHPLNKPTIPFYTEIYKDKLIVKDWREGYNNDTVDPVVELREIIMTIEPGGYQINTVSPSSVFYYYFRKNGENSDFSPSISSNITEEDESIEIGVMPQSHLNQTTTPFSSRWRKDLGSSNNIIFLSTLAHSIRLTCSHIPGLASPEIFDYSLNIGIYKEVSTMTSMGLVKIKENFETTDNIENISSGGQFKIRVSNINDVSFGNYVRLFAKEITNIQTYSTPAGNVRGPILYSLNTETSQYDQILVGGDFDKVVSNFFGILLKDVNTGESTNLFGLDIPGSTYEIKYYDEEKVELTTHQNRLERFSYFEIEYSLTDMLTFHNAVNNHSLALIAYDPIMGYQTINEGNSSQEETETYITNPVFDRITVSEGIGELFEIYDDSAVVQKTINGVEFRTLTSGGLEFDESPTDVTKVFLFGFIPSEELLPSQGGLNVGDVMRFSVGIMGVLINHPSSENIVSGINKGFVASPVEFEKTLVCYPLNNVNFVPKFSQLFISKAVMVSHNGMSEPAFLFGVKANVIANWNGSLALRFFVANENGDYSLVNSRTMEINAIASGIIEA